ncbi:Rne/Rng family ribonuclease [Brevundimonas naejangsanensis]|uniref:Rne/Rng family ribonuclease n=1 Tax=Brevundimonas naejangsanensis TaxID=588932 RepID=UPI00106C7496|nr:ribonuclease E/G [Brevundimonas naejangsanensis]QBQ47850.1 ribonuclease E/G [Brevundimonas naejangsanensis]
MSKTMLIDAAHAEETRVAIVDGRQVEEFDFESRARRQLRGNIYLAKVTRVEPSLQAAFVEYGGNRHGFLAFNEIHPDYYQIPVADREAIMAEAQSDDDDDHDDLGRESDDGESEGGLADEERLKRRLMRRYKIQDVIKRRQILLVQVVKDERGAKGAALTTWLSLAGRYCVLMPNTGKGGGISRKITNTSDRRRLKAAAAALKVPQGMGLIIRTAGAKRTRAEIKRDYEYLLRLWSTIRETTLSSNAPAMIYEEENLVRRAVRDMYDKDFDGIQVEGVEGFKQARDFMRVLMPSQAKKIHLYQGSRPLFAANGIEEVLAQIHQPVVPLKSGGYLVINQTEALVAIDVNSGRSTKERNVEATATKTNMEAAVEAARQLRLRDLAGLIVIDFIDMDEGKNNRAVEKAVKDALAKDRARIQMGRISGFGLMEISRQRRRLGVIEGATEVCECCQGAGRVRSAESAALTTLRAVDIEAGKNGAGSVNLRVSTAVALYILNHKRAYLQSLLEQRGLNVVIQIDDSLAQGEHSIERTETNEDFVAPESHIDLADLDDGFDDSAFDDEDEDHDEDEDFGDDQNEAELESEDEDDDESRARQEQDDDGRGGRRRRRRRGGGREDEAEAVVAEDDDDGRGGRRRRGRRGGRRVREEGERDVFTWVRGRTPSLQDPYVWFDPINPAPVRAERVAEDDAERSHEPRDVHAEQATEGEGRNGRSRRRRGRGRGRGEVTHEAKVEDRAVNEGLPPVGSPDTPIAVVIDDETSNASPETATEAAAVLEPVEAPKRRRVRRKVTSAIAEELNEVAAEQQAEAAAPEATAAEAEAPAEVEQSAPVPAELDVTPAVAARIEQAIEEVLAEEAVVLAEPVTAPTPEVDIAAIIAEDPNQIVAPPTKPKRGWWRR